MARLVDELLALARLDQRPRVQCRAGRPGRAGARRGRGPERAAAGAAGRGGCADACLVLGDEATLCQIVANLLANVRTHTPVSADVGLRRRRRHRRGPARPRRGPRMRPQDAERIFDRFFRASRDGGAAVDGVVPAETGSGLGMAVVRAARRGERRHRVRRHRPGRGAHGRGPAARGGRARRRPGGGTCGAVVTPCRAQALIAPVPRRPNSKMPTTIR
ncbi:ATP-binding protein [Yinghuangia aomiensis]